MRQKDLCPNWLWRSSLLFFLFGSLIALGLLLALLWGWRSPTPRRPPDWQADGQHWRRQGAGTYTAEADGGRLTLTAPEQFAWLIAGPHLADLELEADLRSLTAGEDNGYGLLYGYQDEANYQLFGVGGDGRYAIWAVEGGEIRTLREWQLWPHVRRGAAHNRLRVHCMGGTCRFYVNGEFTAQVEGDALVAGQVGVFAQTYSDLSLTVLCEGLRLWSLTP